MADVNAHHPAWFSFTDDNRASARGEQLHTTICDSDLALLNSDSPTRLRAGHSSSSDISLISAHLLLDASWCVDLSLSSDHLPILISFNNLNYSYHGQRKSFPNFKKADWEKFREEVEANLNDVPPPTSCSQGERILRNVIQAASKHHVPNGVRKNYVHALSDEAKDLIQQRDQLRQHNPNDPDIFEINEQINAATNRAARQAWISEIESCDHRTHSHRFWSLLKRLSGKQARSDPNQPINFNNKFYNDDKDIAFQFIKQFAHCSPHPRSHLSRRVLRTIKREHPIDHEVVFFSADQVQSAINSFGSSTAVGPDNLNILHFKNLGPIGVNYLTSLLNISLSSSDIPAIWKMAYVIFIPKTGKPIHEGTSYRPISLLSPAAKIAEKLLLPYLQEHLPSAEQQHGFRSSRSTTSALLPLVHQVATGINQRNPPNRTVALANRLHQSL